MSYGLYLSAAGAQAQSQRLEVLTNNLANVDTVGFRREFALLQARSAEAIERGELAPGLRGLEDVGGGVNLRQTMTDFRPGAFQRTNIPSDLAIDDDGGSFFVVEKDGARFLTRAGNFQFNTLGELRTPGGHAVLGEDGAPLTADPLGPTPTFSLLGEMRQGGRVAPLKMVSPEDLAALQKAGENLFRLEGEPASTPLARRRVRSGELEQSSVRPIEAMMEMIEASRGYEANARLMQHQDHMTSTLLSRVLRG